MVDLSPMALSTQPGLKLSTLNGWSESEPPDVDRNSVSSRKFSKFRESQLLQHLHYCREGYVSPPEKVPHTYSRL